ncbi:MAG: glycoside hydrolase family 31 protein [Cytophagaceae bacterium]|nr:glycoside hydrolase family 31 protein [Cytophagaceae bacterium]
MRTFSIFFLILIFTVKFLNAQNKLTVAIEKGESWYGGAITDGTLMPFSSGYKKDLYANNFGNQTQPFLISNTGRWVWSDGPFAFKVENGQLLIEGKTKLILERQGVSLKDAYLAASKKYFPAIGKYPDPMLFKSPQYNTWIELMYNQNQEDILKYARNIISNGLPPGVIMIDDNWQEDYGKWDFHPGRFPDPKKMMNELHSMGFKVMLWICPFVSPDCDVYREQRKNKIFLLQGDSLKTKWKDTDQPTMINWWNGMSAELDFSNPQAVEWFKGRLDYLMKNYGVDGFKFDAGDTEFYTGNIIAYDSKLTPNQHTELFGKIGVDYPLNEFRAMWKMAGQPLAERLRDKAHNWNDLSKLIPDILALGIVGHNFSCPDMIGGGEYSSFLDNKIDQELMVRSAQCHALMPMMQFSAAPWRVLDQKHFNAVKKAVEIRKQYTDMIWSITQESAKSGEPIVRYMEYEFPGQGFENTKDQFMLGKNILVAPVLKKGQTKREVKLPKGKWKTQEGKIIKGGTTVVVEAPLDVLPYFTLTK